MGWQIGIIFVMAEIGLCVAQSVIVATSSKTKLIAFYKFLIAVHILGCVLGPREFTGAMLWHFLVQTICFFRLVTLEGNQVKQEERESNIQRVILEGWLKRAWWCLKYIGKMWRRIWRSQNSYLFRDNRGIAGQEKKEPVGIEDILLFYGKPNIVVTGSKSDNKEWGKEIECWILGGIVPLQVVFVYSAIGSDALTLIMDDLLSSVGTGIEVVVVIAKDVLVPWTIVELLARIIPDKILTKGITIGCCFVPLLWLI